MYHYYHPSYVPSAWFMNTCDVEIIRIMSSIRHLSISDPSLRFSLAWWWRPNGTSSKSPMSNLRTETTKNPLIKHVTLTDLTTVSQWTRVRLANPPLISRTIPDLPVHLLGSKIRLQELLFFAQKRQDPNKLRNKASTWRLDLITQRRLNQHETRRILSRLVVLNKASTCWKNIGNSHPVLYANMNHLHPFYPWKKNQAQKCTCKSFSNAKAKSFSQRPHRRKKQKAINLVAE